MSVRPSDTGKVNGKTRRYELLKSQMIKNRREFGKHVEEHSELVRRMVASM
jgi:hypothetical protein